MSVDLFNVPSDDGPVPMYEVVPRNPSSAVIVLHEEFGLTNHVREVCRRLGDEGHHVIAPDLFHRTGGEPIPYSQPEMIEHHVGSLTDDNALADVEVALRHLKTRGDWSDDQIGILGFGLGGRFALTTAMQYPIAAAVSFYPLGVMAPAPVGTFPSLATRISEIRAPWLALFGVNDPEMPSARFLELEERLDQATLDVFTRVVRYPRAGYAFDCDMRALFEREAAFDGWQRTSEWFDKRLAPRPSPYHAAWLASKPRA